MEKPLSRDDLKYVDWFRRTRDVTKAGQRIHIGPRLAKRLHDRIEIQEEIERQDMIVMGERARVQVATEIMCNEVLDREHLKLVNLDEKQFGDLKLEAIKLGNVLTGRIQLGNIKTTDLAPVSDDTGRPNFYQANLTINQVAPAPLLPTENKDHAFPIAPPPGQDVVRQRVRELTTPKTEPVAGTRSSAKVSVF